MNDGTRQYQAMEIQAMSPARRVVFLYDFLLSRLRMARQVLETEDISQRTMHFLKAQDAVIELLGALDEEASPELVGRLAALYAYFQGEIVQIGVRPNRDRLDQLISLVATLHQAWVHAAEAADSYAGP